MYDFRIGKISIYYHFKVVNKSWIVIVETYQRQKKKMSIGVGLRPPIVALHMSCITYNQEITAI